MEREPLLKKTFELLHASRLTQREIAEGADVGYEWLRKFKANLIPDPSINRVQALHDFLSQPAEIKSQLEARTG
jgi:hypothetical protein